MNTKAEVQAWIATQVRGQSEVQIPSLVTEAIAHFRKDDAFVARFLEENLRLVVYSAIQNHIARSRDGGAVAVGGTLTNADAIKARAKTGMVFAKWREHVGDRHVLLLDMTREDLLVASKERRERGDREHDIARLWDALANKLEGGQQVREAFTPLQIAQLKEDMEKAKQRRTPKAAPAA